MPQVIALKSSKITKSPVIGEVGKQWLTKGKLYDVEDRYNYGFIIIDDLGKENHIDYDLNIKHKYFLIAKF